MFLKLFFKMWKSWKRWRALDYRQSEVTVDIMEGQIMKEKVDRAGLHHGKFAEVLILYIHGMRWYEHVGQMLYKRHSI